MLTFILRRVLSGIVLIVVITVIAFTLLYLGSGNIARTILGQNATEEVVAQKAAELGPGPPARSCSSRTGLTPRSPATSVARGSTVSWSPSSSPAASPSPCRS